MTPQIEAHLKANSNMRRTDIIMGNFLGGLAWGFGTVIGASVVVAVLVYGLQMVGIFEPLESFFGNSVINKTLPRTDQ